MLKHVAGLDHLVVLVHDLDAAAALWRGFGFTVSPRGEHSAHLKTANHTIMLPGDDYIELLAVTGASPTNGRWRRTLAVREGLAGAALRLSDARLAAEELGGFAVRDFGRPVTMPDGRVVEARFSVFDVHDDAAPELRLFACQHHTPEAVWVPNLLSHANGAQRILRIEQVAAAPEPVATALATHLRGTPERLADGFRVATAAGRAAIEVMTQAAFAARHKGQAAPAEGPAAIVLHTDSAPRAAMLNGVLVCLGNL
jgi:hypothetical protein